MTDLPGGPVWLNGQSEGDADNPAPTPAGGPFAAPAPPEWPAEAEAPGSLAAAPSTGQIPPPPVIDSPWVDPPPPGVESAPAGGSHLFNGPPPLFAADHPYAGESDYSATTQTVDQSVWTTPDIDGFDDLTAPRPVAPTPLSEPAKGKGKTKVKAKRAKAAPATPPVGAPAAAAPKKAKGKSSNESNLPKLLAALGVTVLIAAIALFAMGRGDDEAALDAPADTSADTAAEPAADPADAAPEAAADPADAAAAPATDPATGAAVAPAADPATDAAASPGDEEAARSLLAEVWANAGAKRDVHSRLMATISEMAVNGDPSAVRAAAGEAANTYRAEADLWNAATERISALGDPYRTSLLMLKRANEVMLAGADELTACQACTADEALALARNGERLTSDGMADIIAILPPVVTQAEVPPAN
ncbi:MAG: hypothetical protein GX868_15250 [Actinobacteria bacterium]|nr:hypothetical protein [Actinomycetota bacterium]